MLRKHHTKTLAWPEKTLSMMQQQQLEDSEARIAQLPSFGLWSGCDDGRVEELWAVSYEAQERTGECRLHTVAGLRSRVLDQLGDELLLLPPGEYDLIWDLVRDGGELQLSDWNETAAAESLVRRLWCTLRREDGGIALQLPRELRQPLGRLLSSDEHGRRRDLFMRHMLATCGALNVYGMLRAEDVLAFFNGFTNRPGLVHRLLHTGFDYAYSPEGEMMLLHPALAEPEHWFHRVTHVDLSSFLYLNPDEDIPQLYFSEAERSAAWQLGVLAAPCLRPEIQPPMVVEDLRMLAKQGIGMEILTDVLSAQLICKPTREMLDALRVLAACTPGFICVHTRRVH